MNKIFIVDKYKNPDLLKFTETKVFFDAKNQGLEWADDIEVVDDISQVPDVPGIVINSNQFITTTFRKKYQQVTSLIDARQDIDLIEFTPVYNYSSARKPPYEEGSKQLYILTNLFKTALKSKKLVYLENTEHVQDIENIQCVDHFAGLASGWKSIQLIKQLGINNLKSITIFDVSQRQLDFHHELHKNPALPTKMLVDKPYYGTYNPPQEVIDFWPEWHSTSVDFKILNLFDTPIFPDNSLIWISNVFGYEPNIFEHGWNKCKIAKDRLQRANSRSIII
jgi:hypothetical protein